MINLREMVPIFSITADGKPFAVSRVLRIEITDAAGFESDELVIQLDDTFPQIERPREGAAFAVALGFLETGLVEMGTFIFEEIERDGQERTMTLIAKAADHAKSLKQPKTRSWSDVTFGEIVRTIAPEHGLKPVVAVEIDNHPIHYAAQTEESDQNFLTRMGKRVGAICAPKDGHLLATIRRSGETASGQKIPAIEVTLDQLVSNGAYHVRLKPRSRFAKVIANYEDQAAGITRQEIVKVTSEGPSMTLREVFQTRKEARRAAEAKAIELKAGEGELSLRLAGHPHARAEAPINVSGVSLDADGAWIASTVTHTWDYGEDGGATTTVEAEFGMNKEDEQENGKGGRRKAKARKKESAEPAESTTQSGGYISILDRS